MALPYHGGWDLLLFRVAPKSHEVLFTFTPLLCWTMLGELAEQGANEITTHHVSLCFEGSYEIEGRRVFGADGKRERHKKGKDGPAAFPSIQILNFLLPKTGWRVLLTWSMTNIGTRA